MSELYANAYEEVEPGDARYCFEPDSVPAASVLLDEVFRDPLHGWRGWALVHDIARTRAMDIDGKTLRQVGLIASRRIVVRARRPVSASLSVEHLSPHPGDDAIADQVILLWRTLVHTTTIPGSLARLNDLLFVHRSGRVTHHGKVAVVNYLRSIRTAPDGEITPYSVRAWTLARELRSADLEDEVRDEIQRRVTGALGAPEPPPLGRLFPLFDILVTSPRFRELTAGEREFTSEVLEECARATSVGGTASLIASLRRRILGANAESRLVSAIDTEEVLGHFRWVAASRTSVVRQLRLEDAARVATQRGLPSLASEAARQMQSIDPESLNFERVSHHEPIPIDIPESLLEPYTAFLGWQGAMAHFCQDPVVPSGAYDQHLEFAIENRSVLDDLFPTTIFGTDNLPKVTFRTQDERDLEKVVLASRMSAEFWGRIQVEALHRIRDHYEEPDLRELEDFFIEQGAPNARTARSLAKGFQHFWNNDFESAVAVVMPKIEASARSILRALDVGIYQVQTSRSPGEYPPLYVLIEKLSECALDPDWAWFLKWLLTGPMGMNLRNEYAHGLVGNLDPTYAALVLRAGVLLGTASANNTEFTSAVSLQVEAATTRHPEIVYAAEFASLLQQEWARKFEHR